MINRNKTTTTTKNAVYKWRRLKISLNLMSLRWINSFLINKSLSIILLCDNYLNNIIEDNDIIIGEDHNFLTYIYIYILSNIFLLVIRLVSHPGHPTDHLPNN